jgi:hypothetical protein
MKNILIISALVLVLFSCKQNQKNTETNDTIPDTSAIEYSDEETTTGDTLQYTTKGFNKKNAGCVSESANCASFEASFPLLNKSIHGKVADSINNFIRELLYKPLIGEETPNGLTDLLKPYFEAYNESLQTSQNEGEDSIAAWSFNRQFSVLKNTPTLFTVSHYERSYAGGAHPNSFRHFHHFNPKTGELLFLLDFFKEGYRKKLTAIAEKKFRKQLNISPNTSLEDEGFWFSNKVFELTENFWFKDNAIHFLYNPYEVASYAVGPIEVKIPYSEIEDLLKPEILEEL